MIIKIVKIKTNETRLNTILKLFLVKTPNIKILNIDKDKKTSELIYSIDQSFLVFIYSNLIIVD